MPRLGLRYSNDDGLPPGVVPETEPDGNKEENKEGTEGEGKSVYSTALATQLVAKTLAQKRDELINSFNAVGKFTL